jgi:DNA-binding NarL/FixJ family response regulator/class 3 adenylate cyclase
MVVSMSDLPTGTVTLLFTDVEGSTGLIRQVGDRYGEILDEHRRLLRGAVAGHGGHEVDTSGDGSFVAFASARDGVAAAVAAQRAMAGHRWPGDAVVRTRMALHTGEPRRAEEGYHGLGVHLAARLCQAGAGGQILMSESTRAVVADDLPPGVTVRDLGERALKDFDRPQAVFEAVITDIEPGAGTGATAAVRVVLAEDSVLLREGIARLLEVSGFEVVGQVDNPDDLVRRVGFSKPDVAIIDIRMPPTHTDEGLQAARRIRERYPRVGVLVLSQYVEAEYATALLSERTEGTGYLLKDRVADIEEFTDAVRRVAAGGSALDPAVVAQLVGRPRHDDPLSELTAREREVLELMAEGLSNRGIAARLVVTERAVEKHVTNIFAKLGLTATAEDHRRVRAVLALLGSG